MAAGDVGRGRRGWRWRLAPFTRLAPTTKCGRLPHSALDLLAAFGGRRTFSLVGAEAIGNKTREDQWAWLAIRFSGIRNEEWIAEGVDMHVTSTYPG